MSDSPEYNLSKSGLFPQEGETGGTQFDSIISILNERAQNEPHSDALRFIPDGADSAYAECVQNWTWRALNERARGVALALAETGHVERGQRVLLVYSAGLDFSAAFYGCLTLGLVPVPVPPPRRGEKLARWELIAKDAQVCGILTSRKLLDQMRPLVEALGDVFCMAPACADPNHAYPSAEAFTAPSIAPQDLAFLQYTSGSTSAPKGVMLTHENIMANLGQIASVFQAGPSDRMISWLPHYHDMGLIGTVLFPLYVGMSITYTSPAAFLRSPMRFLNLASEVQATGFGAPNFGFEHCVRHASPAALARLDLSNIRIAFSGAETIRPETLEAFYETFAEVGLRREALLCCYGMAETVLLVSGGAADAAPQIMKVQWDALRQGDVVPAQDGLPLASCGAPPEGIEVAIVDPDQLQRMAGGKVGEIWVRGPNVVAGYWRKPVETTGSFNQRLDGLSDWFRTGDLGFVAQGQVYVTGRMKEAIVIRGQNHAPHDIEATAAAATDALAGARVAAFALEQDGEEQLGLVVELRREGYRRIADDPKPTLETLRAVVTEVHGVRPVQIALIRPGSMPVTPSGKIMRFACRDALRDGTLMVLAHWGIAAVPTTPTGNGDWQERLLATAPLRRKAVLTGLLQDELAHLAGVADGKSISPKMRFFDVGLDSVAGVQFAADLEKRLNLALDPTLIYEHPTLDALVPRLIAELFQSDAPVPPQRAETPSDLTDEIAALEALLRA